MAKYLAIFSDTLNDIEINGFMTMTDKEVENFEELASSITWEINHELGGEVLVYSSGDDLLSRIDFKEISNEEFKALKKCFDGKFGVFIDESDLLNHIDEEEDEDDDDYEGRNCGDDDDDY